MLYGVAVTTAPVVADSPVAGAQVYVVAPDAVSVLELPIHRLPVGDMLITAVGIVFTVTICVTCFVQPLEPVPVMVYVLVVVLLHVTEAPVVADRPVAGVQV